MRNCGFVPYIIVLVAALLAWILTLAGNGELRFSGLAFSDATLGRLSLSRFTYCK